MEDLPVAYDPDNEILVLKLAILHNSCFEEFIQKVEPEDFYLPKHQNITACLRYIKKKDLQVTKTTILSLTKRVQFESIDEVFFDELLGSELEEEIKNYSYRIDILKSDKAKRFILEGRLPQLFEILTTSNRSLSDASEVAKEISQIAQRMSDEQILKIETMSRVMDDYDEVEKIRETGEGFYRTGFMKLDQKLTEGFAPKKITLVAGRPGMAKSGFVINSMTRLSNGPKKVPAVLFAMEMDKISTLDRIISRNTGIPFMNFIKGRVDLSSGEKVACKREKERLRNSKWMYICDQPDVSLSFIQNQIQMLQERLRREYFVVYIDLFGKISDLDMRSLAQSYEKQLNKVQVLARELGVHMVLVAQIGRQAEHNKKNIWKNRPDLSTIKNSGAWEEVADLVFLLFRGKYYDSNLEKDVLEVHIAKQRQGAKDERVYFEFLGEQMRIRDTNLFPYDHPGRVRGRGSDSVSRTTISTPDDLRE